MCQKPFGAGSNDEIESSAQPTLQQPTSPPEEVSESPKDIGAADEEGDQQEAAGDEVEENDDDAAEDGGADKDVEDEAKKSPKKKDAKRKRDSPGHFKAKDAANDVSI